MDKQVVAVATQIDPLQMLERVDVFYNNAWDKLVIFVTIIVAIVGVLIPIFIQWFQRREFTVQQEKVKDEIRQYVDGLGRSLKEEIDASEKRAEKKISAQIEQRMASINAEHCRLHATYHEGKNSELAALWWARAIQKYVECKEDALTYVAVSGLEKNIKSTTSIDKEVLQEISSSAKNIPSMLWQQRRSIDEKLLVLGKQ